MNRTIRLTKVMNKGLPVITFDGIELGGQNMDELLAFATNELEEVSERFIRAVLIIQYMKKQRLPISVTVDTDTPGAQVVSVHG